MTYNNVYGIEVDGVEEITPSIPSSNVTYNDLTHVLNWTRGDGERSMVVASIFDKPIVPLDGVTYHGIISRGVLMVYKGVDTSIDLTDKLDFNLSSTWYLFIYEFNGVQSTEKYLRKKFGSVNVIVFITEDGNILVKESGTGGFTPENNP